MPDTYEVGLRPMPSKRDKVKEDNYFEWSAKNVDDRTVDATWNSKHQCNQADLIINDLST